MKIESQFMLRCREGYMADGKVYSQFTDISYNPKVDWITQNGKFHTLREPVFYATLADPGTLCDADDVCVSEAMKAVNEPSCIFDIRYATLGRWDVQRPFWAINLTLDPMLMKKHRTLGHANGTFLWEAGQYFTHESFGSIYYMFQFLSDLAGSKKRYDYLLTIAFKHAAQHHYGRDALAIIYPSQVSARALVNIVLEKDLVDDGSISLSGAGVYQVYKAPGATRPLLNACSNYARPDKYGNFVLNVRPLEGLLYN